MTNANTKLDGLFAALDQAIIESSATEITHVKGESDAVRELIRRTMIARSRKSQTAARSVSTNSRKSTALDEQINLLRQLAARQPHLKPRLAAVFGSKRKASPEAVKKLIHKLMDEGVSLKRKK